jgi:benzoate-CoA ligase
MVVTSQAFGQNVLRLKEDDICFSAARLFFAYGLGNGMYLPMSVGASAVLNPHAPTPENIFGHLVRFRPTVFFGVPTLYGQLLEYKAKQDQQTGTRPDPNGTHEFSSVRIAFHPASAAHRHYHRWAAVWYKHCRYRLD